MRQLGDLLVWCVVVAVVASVIYFTPLIGRRNSEGPSVRYLPYSQGPNGMSYLRPVVLEETP